jgi:hypothetical protein
MINRLGRYACLISLAGMINVALPELTRADCTDKDLQKEEQKAVEQIRIYRQKDKEFADYVKTFSYNDQARKIEKERNALLPKVQAEYDAMKKSGCLAKSKLKWPVAVKK